MPTKLENLINPQVMADIISGKIEKKIVVTPFAKLDTTLQGRAGDTVTVPAFAYIGDAVDVAEGVECGTTLLTATSTNFTIKKAMKAVTLTDEAVLSGYGNPVGEATSQLAKAMASKVDQDAMDVMNTTAVEDIDFQAVISYNGIVSVVDMFEEEVQSEKVMFIHPKQVTQLRLDPDFISADKYDNAVIMRGEIGMVAGVRIVPSKRVAVDGGSYVCPMVKLTADSETEDETYALTVYLKRDTNVETERHTLSRTTDISADRLYGVALTDAGKVKIGRFKVEA